MQYNKKNHSNTLQQIMSNDAILDSEPECSLRKTLSFCSEVWYWIF